MCYDQREDSAPSVEAVFSCWSSSSNDLTLATCKSVFMIYMSVLLCNVTDLSVHLHGGLLLCCSARHFITTPHIKYLGSLVCYCKHIWIKFCTFPWAATDSLMTCEHFTRRVTFVWTSVCCCTQTEWRSSIYLQQSAFCSQQAACSTSDGWNKTTQCILFTLPLTKIYY